MLLPLLLVLACVPEGPSSQPEPPTPDEDPTPDDEDPTPPLGPPVLLEITPQPGSEGVPLELPIELLFDRQAAVDATWGVGGAVGGLFVSVDGSRVRLESPLPLAALSEVDVYATWRGTWPGESFPEQYQSFWFTTGSAEPLGEAALQDLAGTLWLPDWSLEPVAFNWLGGTLLGLGWGADDDGAFLFAVPLEATRSGGFQDPCAETVRLGRVALTDPTFSLPESPLPTPLVVGNPMAWPTGALETVALGGTLFDGGDTLAHLTMSGQLDTRVGEVESGLEPGERCDWLPWALGPCEPCADGVVACVSLPFFEGTAVARRQPGGAEERSCADVLADSLCSGEWDRWDADGDGVYEGCVGG